jgi:hypothetical protein
LFLLSAVCFAAANGHKQPEKVENRVREQVEKSFQLLVKIL